MRDITKYGLVGLGAYIIGGTTVELFHKITYRNKIKKIYKVASDKFCLGDYDTAEKLFSMISRMSNYRNSTKYANECRIKLYIKEIDQLVESKQYKEALDYIDQVKKELDQCNESELYADTKDVVLFKLAKFTKRISKELCVVKDLKE